MRSNVKGSPRELRRLRWTGVAVVVIIAGWLAFQALRPGPSGKIPRPIGGPDVAQDVNTMLGQQARGFSLPDGEENTHAVLPGGGKAIIVISHMGLN